MFRLLHKTGSGQLEMADFDPYSIQSAALDSAKELCQKYGWTVIITQDVAEVQMAPAVVSLTAPTPPPGPVYRGVAEQVYAEEERVGPPRVPQSKPRLLIVPDRKATPAEILGNLMVVAEGRIVKNAFGALALGDMPLSGPELAEVTAALRLTGPELAEATARAQP